MFINVNVKVNSQTSKIIIKNNIYIIYTKKPAIKNQANLELIDILANYFQTPKKNILIKRGAKNKNKIIEIKNYNLFKNKLC